VRLSLFLLLLSCSSLDEAVADALVDARNSFVVPADPSALAAFETALFPPFHAILQQDVSEFTPFVFQILSQLLELRSANDLPQQYTVLLPPLLTPALWESRGNVPALVRLLRAFLSRGAAQIVQGGQVTPMLGIFQHLIQSKANDQHGFDLLEALVESLPMCVVFFILSFIFVSCRTDPRLSLARSSALEQYLSTPIFILLLTRLQTAKTDKFTQGLIRFLCFAAAIQKDDLGADRVIGFMDGVQPQPGCVAVSPACPSLPRIPRS